MFKIIGNRDTGKTRQLIDKAHETPNSVILTKDKRALEVKAHNYGYDDINIFDYDDLEKDQIPIGVNLFIHQAEPLLEYLMEQYYARYIYAITMTTPAELNKKNKKNGRE